MGALRRRASLAVASVVMAGSVTPAMTGTAATAAVSTSDSYWVPASNQLVVNGHGYGHGHGMSQHGAQGAALEGRTYKQIAAFYYPGTSWGTTSSQVRVLVSADTSDDVVVSPTAGLSVRDLRDGSVQKLPTGPAISRWRLVVRNGRTVVQRLTDQWRTPPRTWATMSGEAEFFANVPIKLWTPSGSRTYRGTLRSASTSPGSATRDTVNVVTLDEYVMGVVPYEMPASWHHEAVKSQAVAARTYAAWSRAQNFTRYYQICDTTACQVYNGVDGEDPRSNEAVAATAGQILTYGGKPAFTQYSASSGGWTSAGSVPYLPAKADPYDDWSGNTVHDWSTTVDAGVLERKYPSIGQLRRLVVTRREGNGDWQGRVQSLVLDGTTGDVTISGDTFRFAYGLRSTWFSIKATPIIARWTSYGGESSFLGQVREPEFAVADGVGQQFANGRMYYSAATGARPLHGAVLDTYVRAGGPLSALGFPISRVFSPDDNFRARFENGSIYQDTPAVPMTVSGAIDERYRAEGAVTGELGWPTSSNYAIAGGERVTFQKGYIDWDASTDTTKVVMGPPPVTNATLVFRTANIPAGRVSLADGKAALTYVLDGADVMFGQEMEEWTSMLKTWPGWSSYIDTRDLRWRELPVMYNPDTVTLLEPISHRVGTTHWGRITGGKFEAKVSGQVFHGLNVHPPRDADAAHPGRLEIYRDTINALVTKTRGMSGPVIIGGDWNKRPDRPELEPLRRAGFRPVSPGYTHGPPDRRHAIDYFMVRGPQVVDMAVMRRLAGDHNPVTATLKLP